MTEGQEQRKLPYDLEKQKVRGKGDEKKEKKEKDKNPAKRNGGLPEKSEGWSWGRGTERTREWRETLRHRVTQGLEMNGDRWTKGGRGGGLEGH